MLWSWNMGSVDLMIGKSITIFWQEGGWFRTDLEVVSVQQQEAIDPLPLTK
jgi:hypothetical protein